MLKLPITYCTVPPRLRLRRAMKRYVLLPTTILVLTSIFRSASGGDVPGKVRFNRDIRPILSDKCYTCHGPDGSKRKAGLRLDVRASATADRGGHAAIVPGDPENSELIVRINAEGEDDAMPPAKQPKRLAHGEKALLAEWIRQGAEYEGHWAFVKPVKPPLPEVRCASWPRNVIDRFILAGMEAQGVAPAPEAERAALIRRVSLGLTGVPPAPADVDAFVADRSEQAYEKVVDRLLASPDFGERWARLWLDLARYADSHGFQRDDLREIWPYRDWVIQAIDRDMPFDRFTIEQLAGDLLPGATREQQVATGFHRCTPANVEAGSEPEETRINQVIDRVNTTGAVWLGATLECARCHDHKYDPFLQKEYYQLLAFFNNTESEAERTNPKVPSSIAFRGPAITLDDDASRLQRARLQKEIARLDQEIKALTQESAATLKTTRAKISTQLAAVKPASTLVMRELASPRSTAVFRRGEYTDPGETVQAGAPAILHHPLPAGPPNRLTLARWLVARDNPLTARVTVNRWWAELFGRGIVATQEDFGVQGDAPSHPELLDWLAVELMDQGWSMKALLRKIVMSATYRQSSRATPEMVERDPQNRVLARGPRFRMDAEMIRDNALAAAGLLTREKGGPPIRPPQPEGLWVKIGGLPQPYLVSSAAQKYRRGIYVVLKRAAPYPSFTAFDASARMTCVVSRSRSNTPLQALTLLNDPVYVEAALALAARIVTETPGADLDTRLAHAFRLCLARTPRPSELSVLRALYEAQRVAAGTDSSTAQTLTASFPRAPGLSSTEKAAWYAVASALLNLDEMITRN